MGLASLNLYDVICKRHKWHTSPLNREIEFFPLAPEKWFENVREVILAHLIQIIRISSLLWRHL